MLKVRIIPCLDVKDGRVVKGVNFVNLRDAGDPVEAAIAYDAAGADELTFLDITASHENRDTIFDVVTRTAEACFMPLTVGGGVRTVEDIRKLLASGADKVSINTAAVARREFVREAAEKFGDQCIVVAIDAKKVSRSGEPERWEIFTHGGRNPTGLDAVDYAREVVALGAGEILLTSMDRDGTKQGFDIALTRAIADSSERGPGSAAEYVVGYDGARIAMTVLTWPLDLARLAAIADRCAHFQTFFDPSTPGIPMTTTRLQTPRTDALVYQQTMRLNNVDSSVYFAFENIGRMAVFGITFPTPNPSIAVKAALPQTFLDIVTKQVDRAQRA